VIVAEGRGLAVLISVALYILQTTVMGSRWPKLKLVEPEI